MVSLESSALFNQLPPSDLQQLRAVVRESSLVAGQEIFREGDPGDGIYLVKSGKVAISAVVSGGERRVFSEVLPGDFFGEMAVLDHQPRSATATADGAAEVYFIPREEMIKFLTRSAGLSMTLLQEISQRMRQFNQLYLREVLQAERMALVGRFASSIVHDLKNPLTIIGIAAEMACLDNTDPDGRRTAQQRIARQVERITSMVNDILEFTRGPGSGAALEMMDYSAFIVSVLEELGPEVTRKSVVIQLASPPPPLRLELNSKRLTRVFYNLILNAVDEMPNGGRITVSFETTDSEVITHLADTGKGIAPEIINHLFEPFATHGKTKGTGLGLSITRRIIGEHGGRIWAGNQKGGGAIFSFSLPRPETATATETAP